MTRWGVDYIVLTMATSKERTTGGEVATVRFRARVVSVRTTSEDEDGRPFGWVGP